MSYDDQAYCGVFEAPDYGVYCEFFYDRKSEDVEVWNNSIPVEEILPIPIWWIDRKIEKNGKLRKSEPHIFY